MAAKRPGLTQALALLKLIPAIQKFFDSTSQTWWASFAIELSETGFCVTQTERRKSPITRWADWDTISSVCFVDGGLSSDCFYIFTQEEAEPIMAPVEASGGQELWDELRERKFFPEPVSGQAVQSAESGAQLWWPLVER